MESSIYLLSRSPPSVPPFRVLFSTVNPGRATRPNLKLGHSSTSLLMGASGRPIRPLITPVVCSVDGAHTPPTSKKDGGRFLERALAGALGALAGALGALGFCYNSDQRAAKVNKLMVLSDGGKDTTVAEELKDMIHKNPDEALWMGRDLIKALAVREKFREGIIIGELLHESYAKEHDQPLLKKGDLFLYMVLMYGMLDEAEKAELWFNKFKSLSENGTMIPPSAPGS